MAYLRLVALSTIFFSIISEGFASDLVVIPPTDALPTPITDPTQEGVTLAIAKLIQTAIGWITVIGVIAIIYAGLKFVLALGDQGKMKKATSLIIYALIGTFLAVSAYSIVSVVANLNFF